MNIETLVRRAWTAVINLAMIFLVWPRSSAEQQLSQVIGEAHTVSVFAAMCEHPWLTTAVLILTTGIIVEFLNSRWAVIFNVGYYAVAFGVAVWGLTRDWHEVPEQRLYTGVLLYTVPVFVIFLLNVYFYRKNLFRRTANAR